VTQNPNQALNPAIMSYKVDFPCIKFSLLPVCLLFCLHAFSQKKVDAVDPRFAPVDQLFKQNQKLLGNDYVALVWKDGKVIYQKQVPRISPPKCRRRSPAQPTG
jgi:hypothetical protein